MTAMTLALGLAALGAAPPVPDVVTRPPAFDRFLVIPLRFHVLTAPDLDLADCKLREADVVRIVGKLNAIWDKAGIHFGLESIVREQAAQRERFRMLVALRGGQITSDALQVLMPRASRDFDGLHVYAFHELSPRLNGLYLGDDAMLVSEQPQLNEVEGGIDEPIPRVVAHCMGLAFGLNHRPDPSHLLATGTTGIALDVDEVERARLVARLMPGVATVAELRNLADASAASRQTTRARRIWAWLAELPGDGATEAKQRRDALDPRLRP
jgi:hypothetical protein